MNNDIIKLLNLKDDCVINSINISANQTKTISFSKLPSENIVLSAILECIPKVFVPEQLSIKCSLMATN